LHRLWMQRFSDNLPRVGHSAAVMGRAIISFRTHPGPSLLWGGAEMGPTNITRHSEGQSSFQRSSGSACWGAMSLPMEDMASVGTAIAGCDLPPPRDVLTVTPPPSAIQSSSACTRRLGSWRRTRPKSSPTLRRRGVSSRRSFRR
jgi:hypothetical protein